MSLEICRVRCCHKRLCSLHYFWREPALVSHSFFLIFWHRSGQRDVSSFVPGAQENRTDFSTLHFGERNDPVLSQIALNRLMDAWMGVGGRAGHGLCLIRLPLKWACKHPPSLLWPSPVCVPRGPTDGGDINSFSVFVYVWGKVACCLSRCTDIFLFLIGHGELLEKETKSQKAIWLNRCFYDWVKLLCKSLRISALNVFLGA